jgi:hypothetical protein
MNILQACVSKVILSGPAKVSPKDHAAVILNGTVTVILNLFQDL